MPDTSWGKRLHWLSVPLALTALGWTIWLLWDSLPVLYATIPQLKWSWLVFTLLGNIVSSYLVFEAFRELFNRMQPEIYQRFELAHLYFTGQLMKHLPGRIWSVAYQSAVGSRASLAEWVGVTAVFMVLSVAFALWASSTALGFFFGWQWGVGAFTVGLCFYVIGWSQSVLSPLLRLLRKVQFVALARLVLALEAFTDVSVRLKITIWCWFSASWLLYLLAWAGYGMAWPGLNASDGIWLCAIYTAAWFVGYISLVTPSGAGVRELVFVLLAQSFPADAVAGMAVLGRVVLLFVDLLLGVAFIFLRNYKNE
ncbi:MAG: hypothetical protein WCY88_05475 [Spongiibacteraceae bacterium]